MAFRSNFYLWDPTKQHYYADYNALKNNSQTDRSPTYDCYSGKPFRGYNLSAYGYNYSYYGVTARYPATSGNFNHDYFRFGTTSGQRNYITLPEINPQFYGSDDRYSTVCCAFTFIIDRNAPNSTANSSGINQTANHSNAMSLISASNRSNRFTFEIRNDNKLYLYHSYKSGSIGSTKGVALAEKTEYVAVYIEDVTEYEGAFDDANYILHIYRTPSSPIRTEWEGSPFLDSAVEYSCKSVSVSGTSLTEIDSLTFNYSQGFSGGIPSNHMIGAPVGTGSSGSAYYSHSFLGYIGNILWFDPLDHSTERLPRNIAAMVCASPMVSNGVNTNRILSSTIHCPNCSTYIDTMNLSPVGYEIGNVRNYYSDSESIRNPDNNPNYSSFAHGLMRLHTYERNRSEINYDYIGLSYSPIFSSRSDTTNGTFTAANSERNFWCGSASDTIYIKSGKDSSATTYPDRTDFGFVV